MARALGGDRLPLTDTDPEPFWSPHLERLALESEFALASDPEAVDEICHRMLAADARRSHDLRVMRTGRWTDHPLLRVVPRHE